MTGWLVIAFLVKHFVCDFPLQAFPYMYENKGTYGHPGGLVHAGIHAGGTFLILIWVTPWCLTLAGLDAVAHYHIDWYKVRLCRWHDYRPNNSEAFWIVLGADQLAHYLTYVGIVWLTM